jgi:Uma2 family endonuclease
MGPASRRQPATFADWVARSDGERLELIRGTLVEKAAPTPGHSDAQGGSYARLRESFRDGRGGGPGGWRFYIALDVRLGGEIFRPDVCGYRRERLPLSPRERPLTLVPDWICEVLSPSHQSNDRVEKRETYFRSGVPHYWLIDPEEGTLEVLRRTDLAYAIVLSARKGQSVRAEPFDAVEIAVDELLGVEAEDA